VYRYLLSALRDPVAADDLTQEFGLSLVRGEFRRVDPQRGRFRDYVKTVLFHLVSNYRRRQQKLPQPLAADAPPLQALAATDPDMDREFNENWRTELLKRTMDALAEAHPTFHAVLQLQVDHPDMRSPEMAQRLSQKLGKSVSADS